MKRMHALPIELPLFASGELDDSLGLFKLDKKLKKDRNYLIVVENELIIPLYQLRIVSAHFSNCGIPQFSAF